MADTQPKEGDQVSWAWGSGKPEGQVAEAKEQGDVTMTTKNNNEVKKTGEPENPALHIERDGHNVVKKASEVEVEESADKKDEKPEDKKDDEEKKENGDAETGEKRKAEETAEEKKDEEADAKKQKTDEEPKANGEAPKKKGRPAKKNGDAPKKETKKREPKRAATETGEPRRSGRNRS
ncbi:hypothetical protein M409DRAFT_23894 [Zasmidium cellare ATCC 36951]|uniref:Hypervirulence associated protein TUDOR domain-containing protein n=1 Tax=Zasmidium cellare ATCC 36951 TaxID=1080233 RepID=A0A6A6CEV4_ZASCE|nr:uncharacterized protein M409DRAFT_23894 [Zasmidium cellare ATCC 36951]KAF2165601.1 hypothetical protein M409DRAFT_23894 [Zasmidium cellare ATCC 36951]